LLRLEGGVRFGAVVGETVNAVAGRGKGRVGVAEEADLLGACNCIVLAAYWLLSGNRRLLTTRCRGLGVSEEHNAALAFLYELRERRLGAIVRLDLSAKRAKVDCVACLGDATCGYSRLGGFTVGLASHRLLDGLDGLNNSFLDLLDDGLLAVCLLGFGRRLLLCFAHWRRRSLLALAELDRHDENVVAKLEHSRVSVAKIYRRD
jgi:hypothetical protein